MCSRSRECRGSRGDLRILGVEMLRAVHILEIESEEPLLPFTSRVM